MPDRPRRRCYQRQAVLRGVYGGISWKLWPDAAIRAKLPGGAVIDLHFAHPSTRPSVDESWRKEYINLLLLPTAE
jgi:hypothetical protein